MIPLVRGIQVVRFLWRESRLTVAGEGWFEELLNVYRVSVFQYAQQCHVLNATKLDI